MPNWYVIFVADAEVCELDIPASYANHRYLVPISGPCSLIFNNAFGPNGRSCDRCRWRPILLLQSAYRCDRGHGCSGGNAGFTRRFSVHGIWRADVLYREPWNCNKPASENSAARLSSGGYVWLCSRWHSLPV